jgi:hypothetical protein
MNKIIEASELSAYIDIGNKIDIKKIEPIIAQAQDVDLRDYLGFKFYFEVIANLNTDTYQDLLNGSDFQYQNLTLHHEGLKSMLANLFMARFITQINTNITPFGAVVKQSENSEPADRNSLKDIAQINVQIAGSKWEIIKLYLEEHKALFPNYNACIDTISSSEKRLKFRKI